jgi:hypothetical protein
LRRDRPDGRGIGNNWKNNGRIARPESIGDINFIKTLEEA